MKKFFAFMLLVFLPCGCSEIQHVGHDQELPIYDVKKDHPLGLVEKRHIRLTTEQLDAIAQYGIKLSEIEKPIVYYSMERKRGRGEVGKAFLIKDEGEYGAFELIVHIVSNRIHDIHILKDPVNQSGNPVVNTDFIQQFIGKNLNSSFEIAKELDDVLTTPAKIKPIKTAPLTSQKIAESFRKWLVISKVIEGN